MNPLVGILQSVLTVAFETLLATLTNENEESNSSKRN